MATNQEFEKLLGIIRQLKIELDLTNQSIGSFQKRFSQTGAYEFNKALAQQKVLAQQLTGELQKAEQQYAKLASTAKQNSINVIPTPEGTKKFTGTRGASLLRGEDRTELGATGADKRRQEEEKLLKSLRYRVETEIKYAHALEQAQRQGFSIANLKRAESRGTSGIERLQFERYDEGGVQRRFDTFVNQAGRATPGISNQFRSFGQGVIRDIGELTKWSIALAAVYGPMRKLQELTQVMIANEVKLAEATISVSSSFVDQNKIFDTAAESANKAGEAVSGVIDAFTLAYRAAGGTSNEVERFSTAVSLLNDSLTLSKLSSLDQASAIDTLAAALRQTNNGLGSGTELLDKWVRVTKVANVDLTTLATGFAVVGDAAEAAGIGVDQLNGLIAAIAETGISSGKETANIARAIVSGFQSENARKELENLGISVTTVTGELRPFLDVMQEIHNLRDKQIISDSQFSRLTLALGGGTRRQAAYSTFIENFDRVFAIAQESEKASGDAQAALERQLETVQTSLDRLGNAFQSLAQTMGTEGGFLSIIKGSVDGITALVSAFDGLISLLGKATPAMAAFVAASIILKSRGIPSIQTGLTGIGQGLQRDENLARLAQVSGYKGNIPAAGAGNQFLQSNILGTNVASGAFQGLALSLIPALQNAFNKEDRFGKTKATADIIGGVAGGVIGSLVAGSPLIGAAVGTAISEAFVNSTIARKVDIFGFGKEAGLGTSFTPSTDVDKAAALEAAVENLYKSIGQGNEGLGKVLTSGAESSAKSLVESINKAIEDRDKEALDSLVNQKGLAGEARRNLLTELGITPALINEAYNAKNEAGQPTGKPIEFAPERFAYNRADESTRRKYDLALAQYNAVQPGADTETEFTRMVGQNRAAFAPILEGISKEIRDQISQERLAGELKGTQYTQQIKSVTGYDVKALQYYTAFGKEFEKLNKDVKTSSDLFKAFSDITVYGAQESVNELTNLTGEISTIINLLNDPALKGEKLLEFQGVQFTRQQLQQRLATNVDTAAKLATDTYQQAGLNRLSIPEVQGDLTKPLTSPEFQSVIQLATQLQERFYKGFLDIPDQLYDGLKASWDEWAQILKDSGDAFFQKVEDIDPQFFQQAMQKLIEEGKLASQEANPYGIQQVDLPGSRASELQNMVNYFGGYLSQNFPKYEQNPEEIGVIFNDYVTGTLHGDNLAIKLALEKLVDLNQKQLDGMYNIPEGATFWVPLQAAYYRNKGGGEGTGLPDVASTAQRENTDALRGLTAAIVTLPHEDRYDRMNQTYNPLSHEDRYDKMNKGIAPKLPNEDRYDKMNPFSTPTVAKPEGESLIDRLKRSLFGTVNSGAYGSLSSGSVGVHTPNTSSFRGLSANQATQQTPINTKLEMKIENSTQLIVDGRVLASVLSPFLASELLRLEASQGTITKRYVI
jgi:TP901 family phage tail tape measure protein